MPLISGQEWFAFDAPYHCLVHAECAQFFVYNGKTRLAEDEGRLEVERQLSEDEDAMLRFIERPFFQKRIPQRIRERVMRFFEQNRTLRLNYAGRRFKQLLEQNRSGKRRIANNNVAATVEEEEAELDKELAEAEAQGEEL